MTTELSRLAELGLSQEKLASYQVICLPENVFASALGEALLEPADSVGFGKDLKAAGVRCATASDLGLRTSILERRADDKWLGTLWIKDKLAVPMVVGVVSSLIAAGIYDKVSSGEKRPQPQIHLELYLDNTNGVSRISYAGDGETLVKVLRSLEGR